MRIGDIYAHEELTEDLSGYSPLLGHPIIVLQEYVGDDCWRFENIGFGSIHIWWDKDDDRNDQVLSLEDHGSIIYAKKLYENYYYLGNIDDSSFMEKFNKIKEKMKKINEEFEKENPEWFKPLGE